MEEPCVIDRVIIDKQHQKEIEESSTKIELLTQMNGAGISKQMKMFHDQMQNIKDQLLFIYLKLKGRKIKMHLFIRLITSK